MTREAGGGALTTAVAIQVGRVHVSLIVEMCSSRVHLFSAKRNCSFDDTADSCFAPLYVIFITGFYP